MLEKAIQEVLFSEEELAKRVEEIAKEIEKDYQGKEIMLISVLRGSFVFMADLARQLNIPCSVEFMAVSSYGAGTESSGNIKLIKDLDETIEGRDVIIVEDIIDSGRTLDKLVELLGTRKPNSIRVCTLLDKPDRRVVDVKVDYTCFDIPDEFVVGYGLDYAQKYRNLPYIGVVEFED